MSYGTSAAVLKRDLEKDKIPFVLIGGFDGMMWHLASEAERLHLNSKTTELLSKDIDSWNDEDKRFMGLTTKDLLLTAPMDEVVVVGDESEYESMKDRKPINGIREDKTWIDVQSYLNGDDTKVMGNPWI